MKILHLSDTTLSGAPIRAARLLSKYTNHEARHIVWHPVMYGRVFDIDLIGSKMQKDEIQKWFNWADVIHYHNRWARQEIFQKIKLPKKKKSVIQIHSPRDFANDEHGFKEEVESGVPIAVIAQYHTRQWPERTFTIPNVVDIYDELHSPIKRQRGNLLTIGYAPSSPNGKGWDNKSYSTVNRFLKKHFLARKLVYQRIIGKPHFECLALKQKCDVGIDEVSTGSYHMSSLEFLSMGVACMANIDALTERTVKDLTGAKKLPWLVTTENNFQSTIDLMLRDKQSIYQLGTNSRVWMEKYWNPKALCKHLIKMYEEL